ncbi:NADH dehydrogenase ubiquinone Fe-S protein 4 [Sphingomonas montana]|uniref:NADH dehydrogenase ubiquinone Fe-S protein 4 n=1 Tax=Sphingomonas montana TaxID=1843236 RepID=UPI00096C8301|nr:NADH dehydrogenase ubiquinone Fe-S protein 4 [Sphingomonas montana]
MAATIFQKIENNMQRGRLNGQGWILTFNNLQGIHADPLTGWQGGGDTQGQVQLGFPSFEAAVAYARREGIDYHVVPTPQRSLKIQSYAENFK